MNDLISRSKIYDYIKTEINPYGKPFEGTAYELGLKLMEYIEQMDAEESVTDTNVGNKWIPCSERLPKSEDKYGWVECNVTVMRSHFPTSSYDSCDAPYDEYFVAGAMYDTSQKIWHLGEHTQLNALLNIEDSPLNCDYVIAWQPLPEPYKGE